MQNPWPHAPLLNLICTVIQSPGDSRAQSWRNRPALAQELGVGWWPAGGHPWVGHLVNSLTCLDPDKLLRPLHPAHLGKRSASQGTAVLGRKPTGWLSPWDSDLFLSTWGSLQPWPFGAMENATFQLPRPLSRGREGRAVTSGHTSLAGGGRLGLRVFSALSSWSLPCQAVLLHTAQAWLPCQHLLLPCARALWYLFPFTPCLGSGPRGPAMKLGNQDHRGK